MAYNESIGGLKNSGQVNSEQYIMGVNVCVNAFSISHLAQDLERNLSQI